MKTSQQIVSMFLLAGGFGFACVRGYHSGVLAAIS